MLNSLQISCYIYSHLGLFLYCSGPAGSSLFAFIKPNGLESTYLKRTFCSPSLPLFAEKPRNIRGRLSLHFPSSFLFYFLLDEPSGVYEASNGTQKEGIKVEFHPEIDSVCRKIRAKQRDVQNIKVLLNYRTYLFTGNSTQKGTSSFM